MDRATRSVIETPNGGKSQNCIVIQALNEIKEAKEDEGTWENIISFFQVAGHLY